MEAAEQFVEPYWEEGCDIHDRKQWGVYYVNGEPVAMYEEVARLTKHISRPIMARLFVADPEFEGTTYLAVVDDRRGRPFQDVEKAKEQLTMLARPNPQ